MESMKPIYDALDTRRYTQAQLAAAITAEREKAWNEAIAMVSRYRPMGHICADPENARICITCGWWSGLLVMLETAKAAAIRNQDTPLTPL